MKKLDCYRQVDYEDGIVHVKIGEERRRAKRVIDGGCLHLLVISDQRRGRGVDRIMRTAHPRLLGPAGKGGPKRQSASRLLMGLKESDPRQAIILCEDSRCVNPEHIMVGNMSDVPRSRKTLRDGEEVVRTNYGDHPKPILLLRDPRRIDDMVDDTGRVE